MGSGRAAGRRPGVTNFGRKQPEDQMEPLLPAST